jgi:hypothetical protein
MAADPLTQVARLEFVVREQMKFIDELKAKYDALVEAVQNEYGAHGALIVVYSDPSKPDSVRIKAAAAALPFEKPKVSTPQQHQHFVLYDYLEAARLKKRQDLKVIESKPPEDDPHAA